MTMLIGPSHQLTTRIIESIDPWGFRYWQILPDERRIYQRDLESLMHQLRVMDGLMTRKMTFYSGEKPLPEPFSQVFSVVPFKT